MTTKRLNEQVKQNARRFPEDFAFRVSKAELELLTEQITNSDLAANHLEVMLRAADIRASQEAEKQSLKTSILEEETVP